LTIAALNDLDILGADVQNAFLTAPNKEKCWMIAGPEFGSEEGKTFLVVKALYGLKSASFSSRSYVAQKLTSMGFTSTMADPDVWLRAAMKADGESYYEYILMYVDDILAMSCDARYSKKYKRLLNLRMERSMSPSFTLALSYKRRLSMASSVGQLQARIT
jgi:hypothetical protein